jgi:hypothetical protein
MGSALSTNPNYLMNIVCDDPAVDVVANLPEELNLAAHSNWQPIFPVTTIAGIAAQYGGLSGNLASRLAQVSGYNFMVQNLSWQIWDGTDPLEFSVSVLFDAYTSAMNDVLIPMTALESLALPYTQNTPGVLYPPGPNIIGAGNTGAGSLGYTSIYLGNFAVFAPIIITSVSNTFDTRLDNNGIPIAGRSEVSIRTAFVFSRQDLAKAFYLDPNTFAPITGASIGPNITGGTDAQGNSTAPPPSTPSQQIQQQSSLVQGQISGSGPTQIPSGDSTWTTVYGSGGSP